MNKSLDKLKLTGIVNTTKVKAIPVKTTKEVVSKPAKVVVAKSIPCYIHLCKFKDLPNILFTQLRFSLFDDVIIASKWCEEHCVEYEIRSHKTNETLIKKVK